MPLQTWALLPLLLQVLRWVLLLLMRSLPWWLQEEQEDHMEYGRQDVGKHTPLDAQARKYATGDA